jgi:hypothetical protein
MKELGLPCPICKSKISCNCKMAIARYLALLEFGEIARLVSTSVPSSNNFTVKVLAAGIDKADYKLKIALSVDKITSLLTESNIKYKLTKLGKRKCYFLKIFLSNNEFIHLQLDFHKKLITHIVTNPNRFKSFKRYISFLLVVTESNLSNLVLTSLDLNIDYELTLSQLLASTDFHNKKLNVEYENDCGELTGIIIGKGDEVHKIYQKTNSDTSELVFSRHELSLRGKKLPTRNILELEHILKTENFFTNISGVDIQFLNNSIDLKQNDKISTFKFLLEHKGFYSARKHFSQNRNFDRDFRDLIVVNNWAKQPSELFKTNISYFFS